MIALDQTNKSISPDYLTLFDRHISRVGGGHKAGLGQRVLEGEELVLGDHVGPGLEDGPGADGGQVEALLVPEGDVAPVVFAREQTVLVQLGHEPAVPHEIHVVARVDGVLVLKLTELQGEQRVLAPGHVLLHLNLGLLLRQPGEPLPADAPEVDLGPGRQVDIPQLSVRGALRSANQVVCTGAEKVATRDAPEKIGGLLISTVIYFLSLT